MAKLNCLFYTEHRQREQQFTAAKTQLPFIFTVTISYFQVNVISNNTWQHTTAISLKLHHDIARNKRSTNCFLNKICTYRLSKIVDICAVCKENVVPIAKRNQYQMNHTAKHLQEDTRMPTN